MKKILNKRFFALFLAALMLFAMSTTAFAENSSPSIEDYTGPAVESYSDIYTTASIAAGSGKIVAITDTAMQQKMVERANAVKAYINSLTANYKTADGTSVYADEIWPLFYAGFDLQGLDSGQATINLTNENYKAEDIANHLAVVSHYNTTKGEWEYMSSLAEIDEKGCATIKFDSYSPILIVVTDANKAMLTEESQAKVSVATTTYTPTQTTVEQAAAAKAAKAPKTAEGRMGYVFLVLAVISAAGLIVTRKKVAK